jgi:hypothetical protein
LCTVLLWRRSPKWCYIYLHVRKAPQLR